MNLYDSGTSARADAALSAIAGLLFETMATPDASELDTLWTAIDGFLTQFETARLTDNQRAMIDSIWLSYSELRRQSNTVHAAARTAVQQLAQEAKIKRL